MSEGLGFFALGIAKSTRKPVAIITTSGTAVANLYPAAIEAAMMGDSAADSFCKTGRRNYWIPVRTKPLTRRRFSAVTRCRKCSYRVLIPPSHRSGCCQHWIRVSPVHGLRVFVHLNLHLRDPLYPGHQSPDWSAYMEPVIDWMKTLRSWTHYCLSGQRLPDESQVLVDRLFSPKGVLVAGQLAADEAQAVARLAEKLGWPLLVDVQSHSAWALVILTPR